MLSHRLARTALLGASVAAVVLLPASAASASESSGCSGNATSFGPEGQLVDFLAVPDASSGSQSNPFTVDPGGYVLWRGSSTSTITDAVWTVSAGGIPVAAGTVANTAGATSTGGAIGVIPSPPPTSGLTPVQIGPPVTWMLQGATVIPMSGALVGTGGTCSASIWLGGVGSGTNTPMFWAGLIAIAAGIGIAAWSVGVTRRAPASIDLTRPAPAPAPSQQVRQSASAGLNPGDPPAYRAGSAGPPPADPTRRGESS